MNRIKCALFLEAPLESWNSSFKDKINEFLPLINGGNSTLTVLLMEILRIQCELAEVADKATPKNDLLLSLAQKLYELHKTLFPWPKCSSSRSFTPLAVDNYRSYRMVCYRTAQLVKTLPNQFNYSEISSYALHSVF